MSAAWSGQWRSFWTSGKHLTVGWMVAAAMVALYVGAIRPRQNMSGIASQRATGLAAVAGEGRGRSMPWKQPRLSAYLATSVDRAKVRGVVGGVPGGISGDKSDAVQTAGMGSESQSVLPPLSETGSDRKMVRTCSLEMIVQRPAEAAERIRGLAERLGGFLVSSEVSGGQEAGSGSLTMRVPAARFEEARAEIRKLGSRVDSERVEAQDVTREYVDKDASLRNLRAEEAQYLAILKQARTVKDTLEVSDKLSEVRGQIEQQQAEFNALSKQIQTVAITVSLRAEAEAQVFGLQWRPLYQIKLALRDGMNGLGDYATTMTAIVFYLPTVLLWLATIVVGTAMGWKMLRWTARVFFAWPKPPAAQNG
jgi:hypothetical protein